MKLLTKTSLIFITVSLFIFFICGVILYNVIKSLTDENINKELYSAFHHVGQQLRQAPDSTFQNVLLLSEAMELKKTDSIDTALAGAYKLNDTLLKNNFTGVFQPYRYFKGYVMKGEEIFELTVYKSLIESNDLIEKITLAITCTALLLVLGVFFLMRLLGKNIWSAFL